ncbi:MAG: quinone-interacting membrane-bound oxidoreductase complex subunit QmoC [Planctomycetota bacterium]|jgi:quinone-modifying oxidoreductase subunit QmoC
MSEPYTVKPDREFLHRILDEGGEDLKNCFQCATCSVVCELSNGGKPFPRKEMIWAQWGLKDRLVADPDVWLCHQCNDCSTRCPRGARPGDVLASVRQQVVAHYAVPGTLGAWMGRVKYLLPLMLLVPVVLLTLAWLVRDPLKESLGGVLQYLDHHGFYAEVFPHWLLIGFYTFFWGLAVLGALVGVVRFWRAMKAADEAAGTYTPKVRIVPSFVRTLTSIFRHDKFNKCGDRASRRLAHLGAFYGFVALFVVSVWAVVALYMINPLIPGVENDLHYPFGFLNPWKILANLGAIVLIAGCVKAIADRMGQAKESGASTSFDWIFVWLLLGVGVTGLLTEIFRYVAEPMGNETAIQSLAYGVYFVHLVLVFDLLIYLPYSKFAHVAYRTVALVYAEHTGRSASRE